MKLALEWFVLFAVAFSVGLFYVSGEGCLRFEFQRFVNYASPIYLLVVLASLLSVGVGSFALIWIFQQVDCGKRERNP